MAVTKPVLSYEPPRTDSVTTTPIVELSQLRGADVEGVRRVVALLATGQSKNTIGMTHGRAYVASILHELAERAEVKTDTDRVAWTYNVGLLHPHWLQAAEPPGRDELDALVPLKLRLVAEGRTDRYISQSLRRTRYTTGMAPAEVASTLARIRWQARLSRRVQLVTHAYETRLLIARWLVSRRLAVP